MENPITERRRGAGFTFIALACALAIAQRYRGIAPLSLWFDDVWVAALAKLAGPLDWWRIAPPAPLGFLSLQKLALLAVPHAELGMQIVPFFAGLALIPLLARVDVRPRAAVIAGVLAAASPPLAAYSLCGKQYHMLDALCVVAIMLALVAFASVPTARRAAILAVVAIGSTLLSLTALFAGAAAFAAAVLAVKGGRRAAFVAGTAFALVAGALALLLFRRQSNPEIAAFWADHLLPYTSKSVLEFYWEHGSTAFTKAFSIQIKELALLIPVGLCVLLRDPRTRAIGLFILALDVAALVLGTLGLYPLGTVRTELYLYPGHFICVAAVVAAAADRWPRRLHYLVPVVCVAILAVLASNVLIKPATYNDSDEARLVRAKPSTWRAGVARTPLHVFLGLLRQHACHARARFASCDSLQRHLCRSGGPLAAKRFPSGFCRICRPLPPGRRGPWS